MFEIEKKDGKLVQLLATPHWVIYKQFRLYIYNSSVLKYVHGCNQAWRCFSIELCSVVFMYVGCMYVHMTYTDSVVKLCVRRVHE